MYVHVNRCATISFPFGFSPLIIAELCRLEKNLQNHAESTPPPNERENLLMSIEYDASTVAPGLPTTLRYRGEVALGPRSPIQLAAITGFHRIPVVTEGR